MGLGDGEEGVDSSQCNIILIFLRGTRTRYSTLSHVTSMTTNLLHCSPPFYPTSSQSPRQNLSFFLFFKKETILLLLQTPMSRSEVYISLPHITYSVLKQGGVEILENFLLLLPRLCSSLRQVLIRPWPKSVWPKVAVQTSSSSLTSMWMWPRSLLYPSSLVALSTNMLAFRYGMGLWVARGSRTGNVCLHVFSY